MRHLPIVVLSLLSSLLGAQTPLPRRFSIDASHSNVGFAVRFMGLSTVRGAFSEYEGTVMLMPNRLDLSSVSIVIATKSINTNSATRDRHLRSPDFFDVEKYPFITFRSSEIRATNSGMMVEGALSMHGVTKRISIPMVMLHQPTSDAWGNTRVTFEGGVRVNRMDYGIKGTAFWNGEFDPGRMAVSDDIDIELLVSADIPNVMRWAGPVGDSLLKDVESRGVAATLSDYRAARSNPQVESWPDFAFRLVGEKLIAKERINDGIAFYEGVVDTRPSLRTSLGEAYIKAGKPEKARVQFEKALDADTLNTRAAEWLRVLSRVANQRGR